MIADLHDDVVGAVSKLRIGDERIQPFMFLFVPVDLAEHHDIVRLERLQHRGRGPTG
jgi:hypothetical protein